MTLEMGDPLMIGDHPAADFLNSVGAPYGRWTDWLETGQALVAWMRAAGILTAAEAEIARELPEADLNRAAETARLLREELRAWVEGDADLPVDRINALLRPGDTRLTCQDGEWVMVRHHRMTTAQDLLARIGDAVADLVVAGDPGRTRQCNGPTCTFWFRDLSRNNSRRWCSMTICGNRAKVRAHRSRNPR